MVDYLPKRTLWSRNHKVDVTIRDNLGANSTAVQLPSTQTLKIAVVQCAGVVVLTEARVYGRKEPNFVCGSVYHCVL